MGMKVPADIERRILELAGQAPPADARQADGNPVSAEARRGVNKT